MKRLLLALVAFVALATNASAMSYAQARDQALFLTDKMAYELNLTDEQYEAAYEINLDYLMGVNTVDDLYGAYWRQRNLDLSYVLLDWQYRSFCDAAYFYRPLYWDGGYWHFGIYARYPHRDFFYFGCPHFYVTYVGGHSWRRNGGRSWYHGRRWDGPRDHGHGPHMGMRDGFRRGDYGNGQRLTANDLGNRAFGNGNRFGGSREGGDGGRAFGGSRSGSAGGGTANRRANDGSMTMRPQGAQPSGQQVFGSRNGNARSSTRTTVSRPNTTSQGAFGSRGGSQNPSRTFTPSTRQERSFGTTQRRSVETAPSTMQSTPRGSGAAGSFGSRSGSLGSRSGGSSFGSPSRSNGGSRGGGNSGGGGHFGRR